MTTPMRVPKFCWACGKNIKPNQIYCTYCGKSLTAPGQNIPVKPSDQMNAMSSPNPNIPPNLSSQNQPNPNLGMQNAPNQIGNINNVPLGNNLSMNQNMNNQASIPNNNPPFNSPKPPPNQPTAWQNPFPPQNSLPQNSPPQIESQNILPVNDSHSTQILKNQQSFPFVSNHASSMNIEEILVPIKENLDILMRKMVRMEDKVSQLTSEQNNSTLHNDLLSIESRMAYFDPKQFEEIQAKLENLEAKLEIISPDKSLKQIQSRLEKIEGSLSLVNAKIQTVDQKIEAINLSGVKQELKNLIRNLFEESKSELKEMIPKNMAQEPLSNITNTLPPKIEQIEPKPPENLVPIEKPLLELPPFPQDTSHSSEKIEEPVKEEKPNLSPPKKEKQMI